MTGTAVCEWCGRAIAQNAVHRWYAVKGEERGYDPLFCDAVDDRRHSPDQPAAGWIDPPGLLHSCYDEMPGRLTREDWQRRWRCSCGKVYIVQDSQRDGFYLAEMRDACDPSQPSPHSSGSVS